MGHGTTVSEWSEDHCWTDLNFSISGSYYGKIAEKGSPQLPSSDWFDAKVLRLESNCGESVEKGETLVERRET